MTITLSNPFAFVDTLLTELTPEKYYSLMRAAQQATILEWRDRSEFPGLAARFRGVGNQMRYGFQNRLRSTAGRPAKRGDGSDYVNSGGTRDAMMKREPHSLNTKGSKVAKTIFKYGGGKINFLTAINGVADEQWVKAVDRVSAQAYVRHQKNKTTGTATLVAVSGYVAYRPVTHHVVVRSSVSYAQDWARFDYDLAWMQARVPVVFMELARTGAMRGGKLKFQYTKASKWQLDFGSD